VLDEIIKQKSIEMAKHIISMSDPRIIISPIMSLSDDNWKNILYTFNYLIKSIQKTTNMVLVLNVIDGDDELSESLLDVDDEEYDFPIITDLENEVGTSDIRID
jgi:hypothetical protein